MPSLLFTSSDEVSVIRATLKAHGGRVVNPALAVDLDENRTVALSSFEGGNVLVTRGPYRKDQTKWTLLSFPSRNAWHECKRELNRSEIGFALRSLSFFPGEK